MDAVRLNLLAAEMMAQLDRIEQVYGEVEDRTRRLRHKAPSQIESAAYQLHNLYSAIEDLLKIVAGAFENNVLDLSRWHTELLHRMTLEIQGVRPALLSAECAVLLDELRSFRHRFRHAYTQPLNYHRVKENLAIAQQLRPLLWRDTISFLRSLGFSIEDQNL